MTGTYSTARNCNCNRDELSTLLAGRPVGTSGNLRIHQEFAGSPCPMPLFACTGGRFPRIVATMSTTLRVARTSCARKTVAPSQAATAVAAKRLNGLGRVAVSYRPPLTGRVAPVT